MLKGFPSRESRVKLVQLLARNTARVLSFPEDKKAVILQSKDVVKKLRSKA